jgi:hypothetical protein
MMMRTFLALGAFVLLAAVGPSDDVTADPPGANFAADPGSTTRTFTIRKSSGIAYPLIVQVDDPAYVAISQPLPADENVATIEVRQIAAGAVVHVLITDAAGTSTIVPIETALPCAVPASNWSRIVPPQRDADGVSPTIGKLYFAVYAHSANPAGIHVRLLWDHLATETGDLKPDSLPRRVPAVRPDFGAPTVTRSYMSATVPRLLPGTTYRVQLYDVTCEPVEIAGSFTTGADRTAPSPPAAEWPMPRAGATPRDR